MFIKHGFLLLTAMLIAQPVLAEDDMGADEKPCISIVKACLDGGYTQHGADSSGKQFWKDCMKPVVLGKTVANITVDEKVVKACRKAKITQLEHEVSELKAVK